MKRILERTNDILGYAKVKDTEPCTINVTTENASFYDSGYINVIATSDKKD